MIIVLATNVGVTHIVELVDEAWVTAFALPERLIQLIVVPV